jgi:hypothetical protein
MLGLRHTSAGGPDIDSIHSMATIEELSRSLEFALARYQRLSGQSGSCCEAIRKAVSEELRCPQNQVAIRGADGKPGTPVLEAGACRWVLAVNFGAIEAHILNVLEPAAGTEPGFTARIADETTGFRLPGQESEFARHLTDRIRSYLDAALLPQRPKEPLKIGF